MFLPLTNRRRVTAAVELAGGGARIQARAAIHRASVPAA